jgi:excreted virulence factor EspC (type VII ESX diderm)
MDGFNVNVGEVRDHSSTVATLSSQVNSACQTASASVHGNAYGMIGQFFAAALMLAGDQVRDGILKAAKSFMDVQTGLTAVADLYHQVDQAHAELMKLTAEGNK